MRELVAIDLAPTAGFVDALRRAWDDGDAVLPLQREAPLSHRREVAQRLGAHAIVDDHGRTSTDGGEPVEDGDALVMATSGTTGEPKGVVLTHAAIEYAAFLTANATGVGAEVHWVACLPLSHVGGLSVITRALHTGTDLSIHDGVDPAELALEARGGATHVSLVPTALRRIDPAPWKRILLGGSAIPADLPPNCTATYGMTESFGGVVHDGLALNGVEVRIGGIGSDELDRAGPIELRSPTLLRCYRDRSDPLDEHGWYRTGDIGRLSGADRRLVVEGRQDDLIVSGGEKVWPRPVEVVLETHPGVAEAAVLGRPDPEWGTTVCAVVVPTSFTDPPSLQELRALVRSNLPVAAAPKELRLATSLPRTALGKLRRSSLADTAGRRPGDTASEERD